MKLRLPFNSSFQRSAFCIGWDHMVVAIGKDVQGTGTPGHVVTVVLVMHPAEVVNLICCRTISGSEM